MKSLSKQQLSNHEQFGSEPMEQIRESIEGQDYIELEFREQEEEDEDRAFMEQNPNKLRVPVVNG